MSKSFVIGGLDCFVRQWPRYRIIPGWKYNSKPLANGNYVASDRGSTQDVYETDVMFYDTEAKINTLQQTLESNRQAITMSAIGDFIFPPIVDQTGSVTVTITTQNLRGQKAFAVVQTGMWELAVTFQIVGSANLAYLTPSLANLVLQMESDQDKTYTSLKSRSYSGTVDYQDLHTDTGIFKAKFVQNTTTTNKILAYLMVTARSATVSFPTIGGVTYPFGISRGALPKSCKFLDFSIVRLNNEQWEIGLTAVENV